MSTATMRLRQSLRTRASGVLRAVRAAAERLLHPLRRRRAAMAARRIGAGSLLVLCTGNICRSPYAAAVLRRALSNAGRAPLRIVSAGLIGPGRPAPNTAIAVAAEHGIDLSGHRSRLVRVDQIAEADLVLVMDSGHKSAVETLFGRFRGVVVLGDLDPQLPPRRGIPDPFGGDSELFELAYSRIDRCVAQLVRALDRAKEQPLRGLRAAGWWTRAPRAGRTSS